METAIEQEFIDSYGWNGVNLATIDLFAAAHSFLAVRFNRVRPFPPRPKNFQIESIVVSTVLRACIATEMHRVEKICYRRYIFKRFLLREYTGKLLRLNLSC